MVPCNGMVGILLSAVLAVLHKNGLWGMGLATRHVEMHNQLCRRCMKFSFITLEHITSPGVRHEALFQRDPGVCLYHMNALIFSCC